MLINIKGNDESITMTGKEDWKQFTRGTSPSTVRIDPLFFKVVRTGSHVLDIGCGHGKTARMLGTHGYVVTGIDINDKEIAFAREGDDNRKTHYLEADATALPFDDETFDACIMQAFLTTLIDPATRRKALEEAHRVAVDGGMLYLGVFAYTPDNPVYKQRYDAHLPVASERGTFIVTRDGQEGSDPLYRAHHYTRTEIETLLEGLFDIVHFKETVFHSYHGNWCNAFVVIARKLD